MCSVRWIICLNRDEKISESYFTRIIEDVGIDRDKGYRNIANKRL